MTTPALPSFTASAPLPKFKDFQRVVFFTGAGLSAESGIPTYRGKGGLWSEYRYEEYACQTAFDRDPDEGLGLPRQAPGGGRRMHPNPGHAVIAEVQAARPGTVVVTQNIDGMHQRAGARDVVELHGSLWRVRCDREGRVQEDTSIPMRPRRCACGAYLRPDIAWFEDALDPRVVRRAEEALAQCDLLVSVGTSGVVYPAASLPRIAVRAGAETVEIDLEDTAVSDLYRVKARGPASAVLRAMAG